MNKFIFLKLTLIISTICFGQKIIVNNQEHTGRLTWADFTGKIDNNSSFTAYTSYKFGTKIESVKTEGDSITINGFEIILELDQTKSWAKMNKVTDNLLIHEQGHFDIGILTIKEILKKYKTTKFTTSNFNITLQNLIKEVSKKYNDMAIKYDKETNHSTNVVQQQKWNNFFSEQLSIYD